MTGKDRIVVTDHALLRFLERSGCMDVEGLRETLAGSLDRAHEAARRVTAADYVIRADGLLYVVRINKVTTVLEDESAGHIAMALIGGPKQGQ